MNEQIPKLGGNGQGPIEARLQGEKNLKDQALSIDPNEINSSFTQDGYKKIADLVIGGLTYQIVDLRDLITRFGYVNFNGIPVNANVNFILVGESSAKVGKIDVVGIREGNLVFGRGKEADPRCSRLLTSQEASRVHCTISLTRDEEGNPIITIIDHSTNGTDVKWGESDPKKNPTVVSRGIGSVAVGGESQPVGGELQHRIYENFDEFAEAIFNKWGDSSEQIIGELAGEVYRKSDMTWSQLSSDAGNLYSLLNNLADQGFKESLGIEIELKALRSSLVDENQDATKELMINILSKVGKFLSDRTDWVKEKIERDVQPLSGDVNEVASLPLNYLRRAVRKTPQINGVSTLSYLSGKIKL